MQVYISLVPEEKDLATPVSKAIGAWLADGQEGVEPLPPEQGPGLLLEVKSKFDLKLPLNTLYSISKQQKCNFVIGHSDSNGEREDVCFFGHEEGRPDLFEVASYLEV